MSGESPTSSASRALVWVGRVISVLPGLMLILSAVMKFVKPVQVMEGMTKLGYPEGLAFGLGIVELTCTLIYLIPNTAVLGAILLTGYLGGAVASHVRVGDPFFGPLIPGVLVWVGLYLRDERLRALVPFRRPRG